jgi:hypothetical protein
MGYALHSPFELLLLAGSPPNTARHFSLSCESRKAIAAVRPSRESFTFGSRSVRRPTSTRGTLAEPSPLRRENLGTTPQTAPGFSFALPAFAGHRTRPTGTNGRWRVRETVGRPPVPRDCGTGWGH